MAVTIDEIISSRVPDDGDFVPAVEAQKCASWLRKNRPDDFADWLDEHAAYLILDRITYRLRAERERTRRMTGVRSFQEAAADLEGGDEATLSCFDLRLCIDDDNTWRRVGDMTGPDHEYVADNYRRSANTALMRAAFHRAVGKKIGRRRTADVLTEEQYQELQRTVTTENNAA